MRSASVKNDLRQKCVTYVSVFLLASLIISIVILASVPPVSKDALTHHLAVPKLYLKHGGIYEIPYMVFSYYPMNLDLLYLIPLYFGNDIVPKYIHLGFAILTACLIFNYLKRRLNEGWALFGAIFFLSIPIVVKLSSAAYVDLGLVFFSTASLFFLLKWVESDFRLKYLIVGAIFCGLAMGTKYNGLIVFFLLSLFVPFIYSRCNKDHKSGFLNAVGQGLFFFFIALLVFSPWLIRNYVWTSNPIYPLYNALFNAHDEAAKSSVSVFAYRKVLYGESWWQMALLPVRIFFQGRDGNPQYFDGTLNPFLLLLPFFSFYQIKNSPQSMKTEKKILLVFTVLYFAFAFFSSEVRIRYISPIIPALVLLSVFGVKKMFDLVGEFSSQKGQKIGRIMIFLVILFALVLNGFYVLKQYKEVDPFSFLTGEVTRDEYIEKYRPEYSAMKYINNNLPTDSRILFIFLGNRGYYCDREYLFDMNYNQSKLQSLVKNARNVEAVSLGFKNMGISHLLIYHRIFDNWISTSFTVEDRKIIQMLFRRKLKKLFMMNGYGLYAL